MENYDMLRDEIKGRLTDALDKTKIMFEEAERNLLDRVEESKNDQILNELRKLNDRMTKIEARLPEPEVEEDLD